MSRPQFPVNQPVANPVGHVVNGGLIDFQDNFNRGMPDYGALMQAHASLAAGMGGLPYAAQMSPAFQQPQPTFQNVAAAMGGMANQTILGHPSFINVGGKLYKPVEEQPALAAAPTPVKPEPETAAPVQVSDADLDRRVEKRLEEWMSNQRPTYGRALKAKGPSEEERAAARIKSVNAGMRKGYYSPA